jgi:mannose-6-phosphate isomerase-like protein (cupin superfamily)
MTYVEKKHAKASWISRRTEQVKKPWGHETTWAGFSGIHGKTLFIKKGERTSFKYNKSKTEVLMLRSGNALVTFGDELSLEDPIGHPIRESTMVAGDSLLVQSNCPYRIAAIEDCEIFEIGNNSSDQTVMIEDDYGRIKKDE